MNKSRRILFATDFSPASERARDVALQLAKALDADLTVLHVLEPPPYPYPVSIVESARALVEDELDRVAGDLRRTWMATERMLLEGPPAAQITEFAEQNGYHLIIVGTHGRRGLTHLVLGSIAERVVRLSRVPVLTVPSWHFEDRAASGRALAKLLLALRDEQPLVLALSVGAIPIAKEIAVELGAPLDVIFVRQVECDGLAVGAVAEDGTFVGDDAMLERQKVAPATLRGVVHLARDLTREDVKRVRGTRRIADVSGRTVIAVTEVLTSEWIVAVAAKLLREMGSLRIVTATPALTENAADVVLRRAGEAKCLEQLRNGAAVAMFYRDAREPSDREAADLLSQLTAP
jgi:predicted phosphoribosyltransferase